MLRKLMRLIALALVVGLVSAIASGALLSAVGIPPYPMRILTLAGINVILAVSLNLINGFTGQFSLGHAGFMAIGAYAAGWLAVEFGPGIEALLPFLPTIARQAVVVVLGMAFGGLLAGIGGLLVGVPSLRLRGDYLAIVTLGFGEIIRVIILNIDAIGGARGYTGIPNLVGFGWVLFMAVLTIIGVHRLVHSSFGRTLIAVREDEVAAEAMGVDTTRAKVLSFVISSAIGGVAGALFAYYNMYLHTNSFTFIKSIEFIIMVVIGGLGSTLGAVVGAVAYTVLIELLRVSAEYRMVAFSLLLIIIMIFRPQGLLGNIDFTRAWFKRGNGRDTAIAPSIRSPCASAGWSRSMPCRCVSRKAISTVSSARTAPGRPRSSTSSQASTSPPTARSHSKVRASPDASPAISQVSVSHAPSRIFVCSST
jgi:branched-chain amino acid transport system permease protein